MGAGGQLCQSQRGVLLFWEGRSWGTISLLHPETLQRKRPEFCFLEQAWSQAMKTGVWDVSPDWTLGLRC